jgi:hypothetical protein
MARPVDRDDAPVMEEDQITAAADSRVPAVGPSGPMKLERRTSSTVMDFPAEESKTRSVAGAVNNDIGEMVARAFLSPNALKPIGKGQSVKQEPGDIKKEESHDKADFSPSPWYLVYHQGKPHIIKETDIYTAKLDGCPQDLVDIEGMPVMVDRARLVPADVALLAMQRWAAGEEHVGGGRRIKRERHDPDLDGKPVVVDDSDD